jgi:hypothetical protein
VNVLVAILTLALLAAVIVVVSAPLRARARREVSEPAAELGAPHQRALPEESPHAAAARRDELEAAREAKYREIRDTELDYRTGKLSREDYQAVDRTLRAEALEILDRLEAAEDGEGSRRAP